MALRPRRQAWQDRPPLLLDVAAAALLGRTRRVHTEGRVGLG